MRTRTIVALLAAVVAMENGHRVAFAAPTGSAERHYATVRACWPARAFRTALLTGSVGCGVAARDSPRCGQCRASRGRLCALVQGRVAFHRLRPVVIDEQHRFGVITAGDARDQGPASGRPR